MCCFRPRFEFVVSPLLVRSRALEPAKSYTNCPRYPVIATLDIEYNELTKAWKRLQELLPLSEQVLFKERPQTTQDVQTLVRDIQASWTSSPQKQLFSHSIALCDAFSSTLDAHMALLMTLPSHQFYSTLLCGTLQSIIKVNMTSHIRPIHHCL